METLLTIYGNDTLSEQLLLVEFSETHMRVIANTRMWETAFGESGREYPTGKEAISALDMIADCKPTVKPHNRLYGAFNGSPLEAIFSYLLTKNLNSMMERPEQFYMDLLDKTKD